MACVIWCADNAPYPRKYLGGGGRQSARTIHFICAWTIVAFTILHVALVFASGFLNNMRSMITGWYRLDPEPAQETHRE